MVAEPAKKVIAIVPARGGSKGIPGKNVIALAGKPLITHIIQACKSCDVIDTVYVTTDSYEIAEISARFGAEIIMRPAELASDEASSEAALLHALTEIETRTGNLADTFVFAQCTSPLTSAIDINNTLEPVLTGRADCCFAASRFHGFIWTKNDDHSADGINHQKHVRARRQDRPAEYLESGAVYAMNTAGFLKHKHRFFGRVEIAEISADRVLEIDEPHDLVLAEERLYKGPRSNSSFDRANQLHQCNWKAIVFDFDGVMTDDRVWVNNHGEESVVCSRSDGMGITLLKERGLTLCVISKERNPVVKRRCEKLGLTCFNGVDDKITLLQSWCAEQNIELSDVCFVGNDVNDIACLKAAGLAVVPSDAHPKARAAADVILNANGGNGAVRELADMILEVNLDAISSID